MSHLQVQILAILGHWVNFFPPPSQPSTKFATSVKNKFTTSQCGTLNIASGAGH